MLRLFVGHNDAIFSAAFSPDGRRIITGAHKEAIIWETDTGKPILKLDVPDVEITSVAFSPDGQHCLTAHAQYGPGRELKNEEKIAINWDSITGKRLRQFSGHENSIMSVVYSQDGRHVVTGSVDGTVIIWDEDTGGQIRKFRGHDGTILSVAVSLNGRYVLTGSTGKAAVLWEAETGREIKRFAMHDGDVTSVAFSPDSRWALTCSVDKCDDLGYRNRQTRSRTGGA